MRVVQALPAVLALSLGLGGCSLLPTDVFAGLTGGLNAQQSASVQAMVADALAGINSDAQMNLAAAYADDTSFKTQSLETLATGSAKPKGDNDRFSQLKQHMQALITQQHANVKNFNRSETTAPDGGKVLHAGMGMDRGHGAQQMTVDKTTAADGSITEIKTHFTRTLKNGATFVADRDRKLQDDGSWLVTYSAVITRKDGKTKTMSWTRTVAADGSESGTGTIVRFDGSTVTITQTRDANGVTVTRTVDSSTKVAADISKDDSSTGASVTVTDQNTGSQTGTTQVADTDTVEPGDK